jgi:hypothetical protein
VEPPADDGAITVHVDVLDFETDVRLTDERLPPGEALVAPEASGALVNVDDARSVASTLPRSYEAVVRDQVRVRAGRIVYAAFSRDETLMGFAFPKEERDALVASEPDKFLLPRPSELRYNWVCVRLDTIDHDELRELVVDAWRMCVPKKVAAAYDG